VVMAIVAAVLYAYWAMAENKSARWFIGPALIGVFFAVLLVLDIPNLPRL
ncbi:MAG: putative membrane protein YfcA, partial [Paracoccaceae bacterium]